MTDFAPRTVFRPDRRRRKIIDRRRKIFVRVGAYGVLPRVVGNTGGLGATTGTLRTVPKITGTSAGTGTSTGVLHVPGSASLAGSTAGNGATVGTLASVHSIALSGTASGSSSATVGTLSGPAPGVTYALRPPFIGNYGGGVITHGPYGTAFDIGEALAEGSGFILTNDASLIHELDRYAALYRISSVGTPVPEISHRYESVSAGNGLYLSEIALEVRQNNESYPRFQVLADGTVYQGPGIDPPTLFEPGDGSSSSSPGTFVYVGSIRSPDGHYWVLSADENGRLVTTDIGTTDPGPFPFPSVDTGSSILSPNGHYWTLSAADDGSLITTDVGTDPPDLELGAEGVYLLRGSGIPADGTDQAAAVQAILTAAGGARRRVVHEGGTIRCDTPLVLPDGVELDLPQPESVLDFTNAPLNATLISADGTEDTARSLTVNAVVGATTLTVAAGAQAGIAIGDWVRVGSSRLYAVNPATTGGVDQYIGELVVVDAVASGSITLRWPLHGGPYNTADSAFVTKVTMVEDCAVRGRGMILGGGDSKSHVGIQFSRALRPECTGLRFEGCVRMGVQFFDCVDFLANRLHGVAGNHTNTLAYAVSISGACQDGTVANCYARDYRHAITCGGGTTTARPGINRRISYINCRAVLTQSAAFDAHSGVEDITFDLCKAYRPGVIEGSGGISCRSPWATITNCSVRDAATYGIWLRNQSDQPTRWVVEGNVIEGTTVEGILVSVTLPTTPQTAQSTDQLLSVCNNILRQVGTDGISFDGGTTAGRLRGAKVCDNQFSVMGSRAINLEQTDDVICSNNLGYGIADSGIRIDDCDDGLAQGNNLAGDLSAGGRGLALATNCDRWVVGPNRFDAFEIGVAFGSTCSNSSVFGNNTEGCTTSTDLGTGSGHMADGNTPNASVNIASAATITVPPGQPYSNVTGSVTITSITAQKAGTVITLRFSSTAQVTDGSNLKLAGNFTGTTDRSLTLVSDGTNWLEVARSVN